MAGSSTDPLDQTCALHLLRRAGFGVRGKEWRRFIQLTRDEAAAFLIEVRPIRSLGPARDMETLQKWWLKKMKSNRHRLREKVTLFWHDHFAVSQFDVGGDTKSGSDRMRRHISTLRKWGFWDPTGDFGGGTLRNLLIEVTRDPAMLRFLDGRHNTVTNPNENYGRELQELFSLGESDRNGVANYTQQDVVEMSRALTGFRSDGSFSTSRFDAGTKTLYAGKPYQATGILGVVDANGGPLPPAQNVIDILLTHRDSDGRPTAARHIAKKMWEWFAYPDPSTALVDELADAFVASGYAISELVRAILVHDEFYSPQAMVSTVKTPVDFALQTIRALKIGSNFERLAGDLEAMGMNLLAPPNVAGWRQGTAWVTTGLWLERMGFAQDVAAGREFGRYRFRPERFIPSEATTAEEVVDAFADVLGITLPTSRPEVRQALVDYFEGQTDFSDPTVIETKVRGLTALLLTLPEYSLH